MKFLDLNGLTRFFGKVKTWTGNNYLSLKGGIIEGSVTLLDSLNVREQDSHTQRYVTIEYSNISMGYHDDDNNEDIDAVSINSNYISAPQFKKSGGTSTQVLMANGSVKEIGRANGVAGLDANGNVPLAQLGNLDTTVAEVVTALPTTNIKKHIYLIKDKSGVSQNQYDEYIYTGNTSATYDASKWEKLGDFRATVDLAGYAKKSEAVGIIDVHENASAVDFEYKDINGTRLGYVSLERASENVAGVMSSADRRKLNGIADNANNYSLPTASSTTKGGITLGYPQSGKNYPVALDSNGKAYVNVPWTDTNTTYDLSPYAKKVDTVNFRSIKLNKLPNNTSQGPIYKQIISFNSLGSNESVNIELEEAASNTPGLMSVKDKNKLDSISSGATADSAITTAEIDALFA